MASERLDYGDKSLVVGSLKVLGGIDSKELGLVKTQIAKSEAQASVIAAGLSAASAAAAAAILAADPSLALFSYLEYRYIRSEAQPDTPIGDFPAGWTTGIPSGDLQLWSSHATKRGDLALLSDWSTPVASAPAIPRVVFTRSKLNPALPFGPEPSGWYASPGDIPIAQKGDPVWASNGFQRVQAGSDYPYALRPRHGLHPRPGLKAFGARWSSPYQVSDPTGAHNPGYIGKYLASHPVSRSGDWWLIYGVDDTQLTRGIYRNDSGSIVKVSGDLLSDSKYIIEAMPDILDVTKNGAYGSVSDYGAITYIANLAANVAFVNQLFAQNVKISAGGAIRGGDRYAEDGSIANPGVEKGFYLDADGWLRVNGLLIDDYGHIAVERHSNPADAGGLGSYVVIANQSFNFVVKRPITVLLGGTGTKTLVARIANTTVNVFSDVSGGPKVAFINPGAYNYVSTTNGSFWIIGVFGETQNFDSVSDQSAAVIWNV